jgi:TfoX/Sxy family transcriptional regulator of competence genes
MFGYPAYFINKNMFIGLFQDQLFVRLAEEQLAALRVKYPFIANLEPIPGRAMKDYFFLPKALYSNKPAFKKVIRDSAAHTRALAPKVKKGKKSK